MTHEQIREQKLIEFLRQENELSMDKSSICFTCSKFQSCVLMMTFNSIQHCTEYEK